MTSILDICRIAVTCTAPLLGADTRVNIAHGMFPVHTPPEWAVAPSPRPVERHGAKRTHRLTVPKLPNREGYKWVRHYARKHGAPEGLALRIARQESGGRCDAVSRAGALGTMQVMPGTGRKHGFSERQLRTCKGSAEAGVLELKHLLRLTGGDVRQTLVGYNCGERCLTRSRLPRETRNYVKAIMKGESQ